MRCRVGKFLKRAIRARFSGRFVGLTTAVGYDRGMANRFQIPLYKLFIVVAIFAVFFRVRSVNGQDDVAYTVLAAIAGVIVSLYILFHRSRAVTIGVVMIMGGILGLAFAQPALSRRSLCLRRNDDRRRDDRRVRWSVLWNSGYGRPKVLEQRKAVLS